MSVLIPRLDRAFWGGLIALGAVAITSAIALVFADRSPEHLVTAVALAIIIGELLLLAAVLAVLRRRALAQAARLNEQQRTLEAQSLELEARADAFQREAARSRSLAEYLRTMNQELRESVNALSRARAETESAVLAREESVSTLDVVLASAPFGIALFDRQLRFERVNVALAQFDARTPDEHVGRTVLEVIPGFASRIAPVLRQVLETEEPMLGVELESESGGDDDAARHWTLSVYPVRSPAGIIRGVGAIVVDTTERKSLERQLLHAQKMEAVGRLSGSIAHDFNNLLTAIAAFGQFAADALPADHPSRQDISQILFAAERGSALTRRLLAFSRQQVLQPRALDINRLLGTLVGLLQRLLGEDVELRTALSSDLWPVDLDPGQMEQVILNLAVNARDAMPNGGRLIIETANVELDEEFARAHADARPGPHVMVAVTDTGSGMDTSTQAHAFEPFFTTKPLGKGTGLGLSTVGAIVKQAAGNISLESERGRGTTFKVYFPRGTHDVEPVAPPSEVTSELRLAPLTVLIVEDDPAVRVAVHRVLERSGCTVHDAENGRQAFEVLDRVAGAIDLILSDLIMPELGGLEFSERVRERWPKSRFLFMSGYAAETVQRQSLLDAGAAFIEKPFTTEILVAKIQEALAQGERKGAAA